MVPQAPKPTHIKEYQMRKMRERERETERERERDTERDALMKVIS